MTSAGAVGTDAPDEPRARPDLRLVPAAAAAWLAAAAAVGCPPAVVLCSSGGAVLLAGAGLAGVRLAGGPRWRGPPSPGGPGRTAGLVLAAAVLCAAGAATAASLRVVAVRSGPVPALAADRAVVTARLVPTADPVARSSPGRADRPVGEVVTVAARIERVDARDGDGPRRVRVPVLVVASGPAWGRLLPGQPVVARGRLAPPRPGDRFAAVLLARGHPEPAGPPPWWQRAAGSLRAGLRAAVSGLPPDERGLVPGLVVGDVSGLPPELAEDFRVAGLTHLLAVSGANCAIVLGFVLLAARWAGVRGRWVPVLGAGALVGFLVLARPQPSVLRATAMGLVTVAGLGSGRRRAGPPALCAAATGLLLVDPWLARSYGFALSVLATAGLLALAGPWTAALGARLPRPLAAAVAVPAAAQAVCAPVVVVLAAQVSLVAIPANLLVAPAVPPATVLGVLAAVVAPLSDPVARVFGGLAGVPAWWIVHVAGTAAGVPGAVVDWPAGPAGAAVLGLVTLLAVLGVRLLVARPRALSLAVAALVAVALVVTGLPGAVGRRGWPPPGWVFVACDVGQGDALVLAAGDRTAVVVDAGPDPPAVDRCLRDLGVTRVAALLLTHLHGDHVEGVPGVLRGRRVGEVVLGPLDEPADQARRLAGRLRAAGVRTRRAAVGERSEVGALRWQVLGPQRLHAEGSAPNNASLVLLAERDGVRILLTGDVEPPGQRDLLRLLDADADGAADSGPVDVLKVPHHGSAYQVPELVAVAEPRLAVVSAGRDNDYGHPAARTLRLLAATGARVLRTDRDGDVAVVGSGDRLRFVRRGR